MRHYTCNINKYNEKIQNNTAYAPLISTLISLLYYSYTLQYRHVQISRKFLSECISFCSPVDRPDDAYYLYPLKKPTNEVWFSSRPIGHIATFIWMLSARASRHGPTSTCRIPNANATARAGTSRDLVHFLVPDQPRHLPTFSRMNASALAESYAHGKAGSYWRFSVITH